MADIYRIFAPFLGVSMYSVITKISDSKNMADIYRIFAPFLGVSMLRNIQLLV